MLGKHQMLLFQSFIDSAARARSANYMMESQIQSTTAL